MQYVPPPHVTQNWTLTKPAASGRRGIVVSQARSAAEAGIAVLEAGGNAADAAVASAFALAAVEPWNSGLGGVGFGLVQPAGASRAEVVDFGPEAPRALDPSCFRLTGRMKQDLFAWPEVVDDANVHGALSFVVPSAVAGYATLHERWGSLPLADLLAPAIALAKRGLAQDWYTTLKIANAAAVLRRYAESARIYLPDGLPPVAPYQGVPGHFTLGALPDTLAHLARAGLRDFYAGDIAAGIIADTRALGGVLSATDLQGCTARVRPASEAPWHGRIVQGAGGLTGAPTLARVLTLMADVPYGVAPDAAWYVALSRALKTAYAERLAALGEAEPAAAESCTTHLIVRDADGMMVSLTTTLLSSMGSRVVLPRSGVLMNNGVMWFDPSPGQPNSVAPGKRPLTNMCPVIVTRDGVPVLAAGASGGRRILAAVLQMITAVVDFGMRPEQAALCPRIDVSGPDRVTADRALPDAVLRALLQDGPVDIVEHAVLPMNFACPGLIAADATGWWHGVADPVAPWAAALAL